MRGLAITLVIVLVYVCFGICDEYTRQRFLNQRHNQKQKAKGR